MCKAPVNILRLCSCCKFPIITFEYFPPPRVGFLAFLLHSAHSPVQRSELSSSIAQPINCRLIAIDLLVFSLFYLAAQVVLNSCEESIGRAFTFIESINALYRRNFFHCSIKFLTKTIYSVSHSVSKRWKQQQQLHLRYRQYTQKKNWNKDFYELISHFFQYSVPFSSSHSA